MIARLLRWCTEWRLVTGVVLLTTVVATWPLVLHPWAIPEHQDPLFSTWRLYQWARNLFERPTEIFQGNIFYDARDVLLYSDAIALPAIVAAPWIRLGVPPLIAYHLLILASFLTAGLSMYLFARDVSGSRAGALVAAVIFTGAPYRIEHVYHLELLWTCWMPLALWAVHRAFAGSRPFALALAGSLIAQLLCCIYYFLFLLVVLPVIVGLRWLARPVRLPRSTLGRAAAAGAVVVIAAWVYSQPYERAREQLGDRATGEIGSYGAEAVNYVATPSGNRLWGWTADVLGGREKRLSAGVVSYALAVPALLPPLQPWVVGLAGGALVSFEASRGLDGVTYPLLHRLASPFRGLRVPSRFAVLLLVCVAGLAAFGVARIEASLGGLRAWPAIVALMIGALLVEFATVTQIRELPPSAPALYAWLGQQPPTVIAHFPMPTPQQLPGAEADYQFFAQYHRHRLVNGNSGYYPRTYIQLLERVRNFPDARALNALRVAGVTLVVVHAQRYTHEEYERVTRDLATSPGVEPVDVFNDGVEGARVYRLK